MSWASATLSCCAQVSLVTAGKPVAVTAAMTGATLLCGTAGPSGTARPAVPGRSRGSGLRTPACRRRRARDGSRVVDQLNRGKAADAFTSRTRASGSTGGSVVGGVVLVVVESGAAVVLPASISAPPHAVANKAQDGDGEECSFHSDPTSGRVVWVPESPPDAGYPPLRRLPTGGCPWRKP